MSKQTIWITGASSGIGEAVTQKFLQEGYQVIISARNRTKLEEIRNNSPFKSSIAILPLDLTQSREFEEKVTEAIHAFGSIDILLNNGGISQRSLIHETSLEVDRKIMEVNYFGTIALSKALLPHFLKQKKGQFAVISSLVGKFGTPFRSSYAASKHALHGFFDTLRAEHVQDNLRVTMICPGFIRTNVSINALTGDGSALGVMDDAQEKGMSPETCANSIYKAIIQQKEEVLIGGKEKYAVYLKRFFPSIFSKLVAKAKVR
ncbi:SDR family oxidoreductase [Mongoliitalea daihaiensis]|uniref:SDR family oxidoreductase n=1 Tax=Mongoliitalea daihaiensis TaxID=2782006 RepID=UPI001F15B68A|nr:SDR family oxidoreductase [Mongoliitalea daihaiensis]UJP63730.1 SDR family oxidoreductase [Mongoliitalea daihaiensis]